MLVRHYGIVHSTDITRVDLTIPGEQYFYLRAINAAERQKWLVALGTAKACLTDNRTRREKGNLNTLLYSDMKWTMISNSLYAHVFCISFRASREHRGTENQDV